MLYIITFFIVLIILETLLFKVILKVRKRFQWLIVKGLDDKISYDKDIFEKFKKHSFSSDLGWEPRPGTKGRDLLNGSEIKYEIGSLGQRICPSDGPKLLENQLLVLGDSFAFGRQVEAEFTITNFLNLKNSFKSYNFGVGNYGLDQAFLRLKKIYDNLKPRCVVFVIVPETICRIQSSWKHFYEYGNILAFKPRFVYNSETSNLILIENPFQSVKKENFDEAISISKKYDKFYITKFKKDLIKKPYIINIFKNNCNALKIISSFYLNLFNKNSDISWGKTKFQNYVLMKNSKITDLEYKNTNSTKLLISLIKEINKFCLEKNIVPVISFIPQYQDLSNQNRCLENYSKFITELKKLVSIKIIDFKNIFENFNSPSDKYYLNEIGGTHLSKLGNEVVSKILNKEIFEIMKEKK